MAAGTIAASAASLATDWLADGTAVAPPPALLDDPQLVRPTAATSAPTTITLRCTDLEFMESSSPHLGRTRRTGPRYRPARR